MSRKLFGRGFRFMRASTGTAFVSAPIYQNTTRPTIPQDFVGAAANDTSADFTWTASGSVAESGVKGYRIYSKSGAVYTLRANVLSPLLTKTISGLTPGSTTAWYITAYDYAGNESDYSDVQNVVQTLTDTTKPATTLVLINTPQASVSAPTTDITIWQASDDTDTITDLMYLVRELDRADAESAPADETDPDWVTYANKPTTVTFKSDANARFDFYVMDSALNISDVYQVNVDYVDPVSVGVTGLRLPANVKGGGGLYLTANTINTEVAAKAPPANLVAQYYDPTSIRLFYDEPDNTSGFAGYAIDENKDSGGYVDSLYTAPVGAGNFLITGLSPGSTYVYRMNTIGGTDSSNESSPVSLPTVSVSYPAPLLATATVNSPYSITLNWTFTGDYQDTSKWGLYYIVPGQSPVTASLVIPRDQRSYSFSASPSTYYTFYLIGIGANGELGTDTCYTSQVQTGAATGFTPIRRLTFEGGQIGSCAACSFPALNAFDGQSATSSTIFVTYDNVSNGGQVRQGTTSAKFHCTTASGIDMGGAFYAPYRITDEFWIRVWVFFPTGYVFVPNGEGQKFIRMEISKNGVNQGGGWDWYIGEYGMFMATGTSGLNWLGQYSTTGTGIGDEFYSLYPYVGSYKPGIQSLGGSSYTSRNMWHYYDFYIKFSAHYNGILRGYADGDLLFENTALRTVPFDGDGLHKVKIFSGPQPNVFSQVQDQWVDDIAIADSSSPPTESDGNGNVIIGTWSG